MVRFSAATVVIRLIDFWESKKNVFGNCGKQLQDGTTFCPVCGTAIYQEDNNNIEQHIVEEPIKDTSTISKI